MRKKFFYDKSRLKYRVTNDESELEPFDFEEILALINMQHAVSRASFKSLKKRRAARIYRSKKRVRDESEKKKQKKSKARGKK